MSLSWELETPSCLHSGSDNRAMTSSLRWYCCVFKYQCCCCSLRFFQKRQEEGSDLIVVTPILVVADVDIAPARCFTDGAPIVDDDGRFGMVASYHLIDV